MARAVRDPYEGRNLAIMDFKNFTQLGEDLPKTEPQIIGRVGAFYVYTVES